MFGILPKALHSITEDLNMNQDQCQCCRKDKIAHCSKKGLKLCLVLIWSTGRYESGWLTSEDLSHSELKVIKCTTWTSSKTQSRGEGDSPLWMRRCSFRWCLYLKAFPHSLHLNLRFPAPSLSSGGCREKNKVFMWWRSRSRSRWADYEAVEQKLTGKFNSI